MRILIDLFKNIYDGLLKFFVGKETGEIATRALLATSIIATVVAIYAAYSVALNAISLALPAEFDIGLMFIPDNTPEIMTIITTMRVSLFIASLKLGLASVGVAK